MSADSINPPASTSLRKLLIDLKAMPPSPKPEGWNFSQLVEAKSLVIPRFGPIFSAQNVGKLSREDFLKFLEFKTNRHWRGLDRHSGDLTKDMNRLRVALALLVDESKPLRERLDRLYPHERPAMVRYLGPAVLTAILHVVYPDRYGVFNSMLKAGMKKLGLWPRGLSTSPFADQYAAVNPIQLELASQLGIDLWVFDYLWWFVARPTAHESPSPKEPASRSAHTARARTIPSGASVAIELNEGSPWFTLGSGLKFSCAEAESRLLRFCREEFPYYDGIPDSMPSRIEPIDVLATVAMNSRVNEASLIRTVHRGLAGRCDSLRARIPANANLMTYDPELIEFKDLIHAAVQTPKLLVAVATKVLHRKRRNFIPMLDNIVIKHYATAMKRLDWIERSQYAATAAAVPVEVMKAFREDLRHASGQITALCSILANAGFDLTPVRILEVLVWTETEPNGYYRGVGS
jgi:hypothetical protein